MYNQITGIILAGGKSTRMGRNKSFLEFEGLTAIQRTVNLIQSIFCEAIIITNTPNEYGFLNLKIFRDIYEGKGPLSGIHSGLINSNTADNFIISCDLPLMNKEMIEYICNFNTDKDITICKSKGKLQNLAGRYSKKVTSITESILSNSRSKKSVNELVEKAHTEIISPEGLEFYSEELFFNMNNPSDYQSIKEIIYKRH